MSAIYTRDQLKISVAKILQTLGWNSITSTPLEILTDILSNYIGEIATTANSYANEFGCTQPNLDHLGLSFRDMGINICELEEYVRYVNFGPGPKPVPKYPIPKEDHLNFLKPGSKEVVTRPVHIHEHLPPMNPLLEGNENEHDSIKTDDGELPGDSNQLFKKPSDVILSDLKKPGFRREEEGSRPTREISSVMMTTSGFLSPAREGKLPESRTPIAATEPPPTVVHPPPSEPEPVKKVVKKPEKKKEKPVKTPFKPIPSSNKTKVPSVPKVEPKPPGSNGSNSNVPSQTSKSNGGNKVNKALVAARLKTEKLNTTITPVTVKPATPFMDNVDKLFNEPDKKKVNIFKKISNVKNEKVEGKPVVKKEESRESSPDLIIDEPDDFSSKIPQLPSDITIEPINSQSVKSPENTYFDDDLPPGTPSTPKTPEMISSSPPIVREKRRKKESRKVKKIARHQSPQRLDTEDIEMERPKTPEAQMLPRKTDLLTGLMPRPPPPAINFPFLTGFGGPGLIPTLPSPIAMAISSLNMHNFGQKPYIPPMPPGLAPLNGAPSPTSNLLFNPPKIETPQPPTPQPEKIPQSTPEDLSMPSSPRPEKIKNKEHKKEKKDKLKKRNKKDKIKNKSEKKKLKEEKKEKIKKEKKEKRKDKEITKDGEPTVKITFKIKSQSPPPESPETTRKLNIKPIVKKDDEPPLEDRKREVSPGLAKISALVTGPPKQKTTYPQVSPQSAEELIEQDTTLAPQPKTGPGPGRPRIHPLKPKTTKPKKQRSSVQKDADGNEVWICPACGRQDDGSPMIGCDGCDAWYHWVCVGIQVPPDHNEDWYCRHCLSKKNEDLQSDKQKKKRKKREKKEH